MNGKLPTRPTECRWKSPIPLSAHIVRIVGKAVFLTSIRPFLQRTHTIRDKQESADKNKTHPNTVNKRRQRVKSCALINRAMPFPACFDSNEFQGRKS